MIRWLLRLLSTRTVRVASDDLTVTDETHAWRAVDAEDHGPEPTPAEQAVIDRLRTTPLPEPDPEVLERIRDRFLADIQTAPTPVPTPAEVFRTIARVTTTRPPFPGGCGCPPVPDSERPSPLTADELDAEIAAYEAGAAERARRAGVAWPAAPAAVGIARYSEHDDEIGGSKHYTDYLEN